MLIGDDLIKKLYKKYPNIVSAFDEFKELTGKIAENFSEDKDILEKHFIEFQVYADFICKLLEDKSIEYKEYMKEQ